MATANDVQADCKKRPTMDNGGALYGLGVIGALVYFIHTAPTFWMGVLGVLKGVFWPAVVVYKALEVLKA